MYGGLMPLDTQKLRSKVPQIHCEMAPPTLEGLALRWTHPDRRLAIKQLNLGGTVPLESARERTVGLEKRQWVPGERVLTSWTHLLCEFVPAQMLWFACSSEATQHSAAGRLYLVAPENRIEAR